MVTADILEREITGVIYRIRPFDVVPVKILTGHSLLSITKEDRLRMSAISGIEVDYRIKSGIEVEGASRVYDRLAYDISLLGTHLSADLLLHLPLYYALGDVDWDNLLDDFLRRTYLSGSVVAGERSIQTANILLSLREIYYA